MKKICSLLALLLVSAMLLCACQPSETPAESNEVYGYWYSAGGVTLEVIKGGNSAKFYSLTTGYDDEYYAVQDATYTYSDDSHVLILTLEGTDYEFIFDADSDVLSLQVKNDSGEVTKELDYERIAEAPTEHPVYQFPNYLDMDLSGLLTLPDYRAFDLTDIAIAEARMEIFTEYYETDKLSSPSQITDRPAQFGDLVIVDYVGKVGDVAFEGGSANDAEIAIIFNSGYIPGFAEGIIGKSVGDEFDVEVTFPENYGSAALAGQDAVFTMTLKTIYDVRLTDEQFANYEYHVYDSYEEWVIGLAADMAGDLAMSMLGEQITVNGDLPEETYVYYYQSYVDYAHYMAAQYGRDYEDFLKLSGIDETYLRNQSKNIALNYILCTVIFKAEGLEWTEEDYQEMFDSFVSDLMTNSKYTEEQAIEYVNAHQMDNLKAELVCAAVADWLGEVNFDAPVIEDTPENNPPSESADDTPANDPSENDIYQ